AVQDLVADDERAGALGPFDQAFVPQQCQGLPHDVAGGVVLEHELGFGGEWRARVRSIREDLNSQEVAYVACRIGFSLASERDLSAHDGMFAGPRIPSLSQP